MTNSKLSFNLMCESFEPLSAEEQISFFRLAKEGDDKSRERLILSNLRLVVSIARRYSTVSLSVSYDDLIQSGFMGILKALDTYSCDFGTKFSTHAAYWIKKEILKVLRNAGRPINFPEHFSDSLRRFITAKNFTRRIWSGIIFRGTFGGS